MVDLHSARSDDANEAAASQPRAGGAAISYTRALATESRGLGLVRFQGGAVTLSDFGRLFFGWVVEV